MPGDYNVQISKNLYTLHLPSSLKFALNTHWRGHNNTVLTIHKYAPSPGVIVALRGGDRDSTRSHSRDAQSEKRPRSGGRPKFNLARHQIKLMWIIQWTDVSSLRPFKWHLVDYSLQKWLFGQLVTIKRHPIQLQRLCCSALCDVIYLSRIRNLGLGGNLARLSRLAMLVSVTLVEGVSAKDERRREEEARMRGIIYRPDAHRANLNPRTSH